MVFTSKSGLPPKINIYDYFKKNFLNIDIKYITLNDGTHDIEKIVEKPPLEKGYVFKIGDWYYSVNPENPDYSLSKENRRKASINNFCNDLIKKSAPDILPNFLKDCKTIKDIKQKLPNVGYEYNKTRKNQLTLKLGDVEFSVPFKNSLSYKDKIAIHNINFPNTNKSEEVEIPAFPSPLGFDGDDATRSISAKPDTLKNKSFKSIELFDAKSFMGIKIGGRSSDVCY